MAKQVTQEEFDERVKEQVGDEYTFLEPKRNMVDKIKVRHNNETCGKHTYEVAPIVFLKGVRCPKCKGSYRRTQKDFIEEVKGKFQDEYTVLGKFKNTSTKIKVRHNSAKCRNYEYEVIPTSILRGSRCPECYGTKKQTEEDIRGKVLRQTKGEYTLVGGYTDLRTKMTVRHNSTECGNYEYKVSPRSFLKKSYCPKCHGGFKKTNEFFLEEVKGLVGEEYTFLEEYTKGLDKIRVRHNSDKCENYEYKVSPRDFLRNRRCPKCYGNNKLKDKQFKDRVRELVGAEYDVLGEYINTGTHIKMRHNNESCGNYEYEVTPDSFYSGVRCVKCSKRYRYSEEDFKSKVKGLVGEEYTFLEGYVDSKTKLSIRHNSDKCGNHTYRVSPNIFFAGKRCPKCRESKGEKEVSTYLKNNNIKHEEQYRGLRNPLTNKYLYFDFAIKDYKGELKGLIEYDGIFHYKAFKYTGGEEGLKEAQNRDKIKNEFCKENSIPLLRIPYWEFDKIECKVEDFLESLNIEINS